MGAALFAALDGRELLATPAELATSEELGTLGDQRSRGQGRPHRQGARGARPLPSDRRRMSLSTITRVGDSDVIRTKPFEYVKIALAANHKTEKSYPPFNPLNIFSDGAPSRRSTNPIPTASSTAPRWRRNSASRSRISTTRRTFRPAR
jgi:hypothetical protein